MLTTILGCRTGQCAWRSMATTARLHAATTPLRPPPGSRSFFQGNTVSAFLRRSRVVRNESKTQGESFRDALRRSRPEPTFSEKAPKPGVWRQVLFVTIGSALAYQWAASSTNIETYYWTKRLRESSTNWGFKPITTMDLKHIQNIQLVARLRAKWANLNAQLAELPALVRPWIGLAFISVMQPYADASEGKRLCWKIVGLNTLVYLAWKIRKLQPAMNYRFMHNPLSGLSYTLLTSVFSHKSFLHLLMNCLALESFGSAAYFYLMREQAQSTPPMLESTGAYHFLAFFISAGLFSGLVSHVYNAKILYPRLISKLASVTKPKVDTWAAAVAASSKPAVAQTVSAATAAAGKEAASRTILPSLGASGAIYACLTMTAMAFPQSEVALFIPPSFSMNIQTGVTALVALDMIGIWRKWRMFDHWAHLGGAAFGVLYYKYGPGLWHWTRQVYDIPPEERAKLGMKA